MDVQPTTAAATDAGDDRGHLVDYVQNPRAPQTPPPGPRLSVFRPDEEPARRAPAPGHGRQWTRLFPEMTLSEFHGSYFEKVALIDASQGTIVSYGESVGHWHDLTGDPPLKSIDEWAVGEFLEGLKQLPGRKPGTLMSAYTRRKHARQVSTVLERAGPKGSDKKSRKNCDLIELPPVIDLPRVDHDPPAAAFTLEELAALYQAAGGQTRPQIAGVEPGDWWRAVITVAFFAGLRRGELLRCRYEHLKPAADATAELFVPGSGCGRSRRGKRLLLVPAAAGWIEKIRTPRALIFPWPHDLRYLDTHYRRLVERAGVAWFEGKAWHRFRQSHATELCQISAVAATVSLGHGNAATTLEHYINPRAAAEGLRRMPNPFGDGPPAT